MKVLVLLPSFFVFRYVSLVSCTIAGDGEHRIVFVGRPSPLPVSANHVNNIVIVKFSSLKSSEVSFE